MNLRKDHCRNLPSRTTREHVVKPWGEGPSGPEPSPGAGRGTAVRQRQTNPGAICAKETKRTSARRSARKRCRPSRVVFDMSKRLSATDISALASMKNVAKCDTWCELQNPVNHRVFERKLRPKPSGRGHVCLGVTRRCPPNPVGGVGGRMLASREPRLAVGPNARSLLRASRRWWLSNNSVPRRERPRRAVSERPLRAASRRASNATPGQAGLPAEFKHINKRRKRNLQGFP